MAGEVRHHRVGLVGVKQLDSRLRGNDVCLCGMYVAQQNYQSPRPALDVCFKMSLPSVIPA